MYAGFIWGWGMYPRVGNVLKLIFSNYFSHHFELLLGTWCHYILVVNNFPFFVAYFRDLKKLSVHYYFGILHIFVSDPE